MRTKDMDLNGKEPVRLRRKKLRNGDYSLYLDVYWNGKRSYEFLKLYLSGEWGKAAIEKNKPIIEIAQQIKHKRILSLRMVKYGPSNILPRPSFLEFFTELVDQRAKYKNNSENWAGALKHLTTFIGNKNPRLDEIDDAWLTEFNITY